MKITKAASIIPNIIKLLLYGTIYDVSLINIINIANKTAAEIDPSDTILVSAINANANNKQINPIFQLIKRIIPKLVATPFPPLNSKNTGYVCPITTNSAAISTSIALLVFLNILPKRIAINIETIPFNMSQTRVKTAAFLPTVLSTLVLPAFPLPFSLTSKPAIFLLIITEKFMLPIK